MIYRKLLVASFALTLIACGSKGTVRKPAELENIAEPSLTVSTVWTRSTGVGTDGQWTSLTAAPDSELVFAADVDGRVSALDVETGKPVWTVKTGARLVSGPSVNGASVLFGTRDAEVISLARADGSEQWRANLSSEVLAAPVSDGDFVVARAGDGHVYGLSAATGAQRWVVDRNVPALTLRGLSTPILFSGAAIIGHDNGRITTLRLDNGEPVWEQVVALPSGRSELERITDIDAQMTIIGESLIAVSFGGELANLNLRDGEILWRRSIRSYTGMVAAGDRVFVTDEDGMVWALDLASGAAAWKSEALKYRQVTRPVLHKGFLVVADVQGYLHWFEPDSGKIVGRSRVGSERLVDGPIVDGDRLFTLSADGKLRALNVSPL